MSIIKKLKETAISIAVKLDMGSTVNYLTKENPELVTNKLLAAAVSAGATEAFRELQEIKGIDSENVNEILQALEKTPHAHYSRTLNQLMHKGLIQESTDFSQFLGIHCRKTANMEPHDQIAPFVNMGHMLSPHGDFIPSAEVVAKAVKDNIGWISYDIADSMMKREILKDVGPIFTDNLIGGTACAKMSLAGIAANADNLAFARAYDVNKFQINSNDIIATRDFAARVNKRYLAVEEIEQKKATTDLPEGVIRRSVEQRHFFGNQTVAFAISDEAKFEIKEDSVINRHYGGIRPPAVVGTSPENEGTYAWYNYNASEIKTIAERASFLVKYQEQKISEAQKKEIDDYIINREKFFVDNQMKSPDPELEYKGLTLNIKRDKDQTENNKTSFKFGK